MKGGLIFELLPGLDVSTRVRLDKSNLLTLASPCEMENGWQCDLVVPSLTDTLSALGSIHNITKENTHIHTKPSFPGPVPYLHLLIYLRLRKLFVCLGEVIFL